ncbi:hypothetical protein DY000_02006917 [Brassica cretica]|uniref:DUF4283 domain-containing protein n=1 Tax=Brassica cretica TaxID=69181 RepID=A0ABQ7CMJ5_BRACR|nr:hypothetical protein DY000_02006917 [Brassica cretica]
MALLESKSFQGVLRVIIPLGMVGTTDVSRLVSFSGEAVAKLIMGVPWRFRWVNFLVSKEALHHSRIWGNVVRLSVSAIYDEHQKAKTRKMRPFYTPLPRLARAASSVNGLSSTSSTGSFWILGLPQTWRSRKDLRSSGNPEVTARTCKITFEPGGSRLLELWILEPGGRFCNPEGLYSAFLGKTTSGTCSDLALCRSEAGHYRVSMLHSASAGSHYQT